MVLELQVTGDATKAEGTGIFGAVPAVWGPGSQALSLAGGGRGWVSGATMVPGASSLGLHYCYSSGSAASTKFDPFTARCTDIWISQASWYAGQRIFCWAMDVLLV